MPWQPKQGPSDARFCFLRKRSLKAPCLVAHPPSGAFTGYPPMTVGNPAGTAHAKRIAGAQSTMALPDAATPRFACTGCGVVSTFTPSPPYPGPAEGLAPRSAAARPTAKSTAAGGTGREAAVLFSYNAPAGFLYGGVAGQLPHRRYPSRARRHRHAGGSRRAATLTAPDADPALEARLFVSRLFSCHAVFPRADHGRSRSRRRTPDGGRDRVSRPVRRRSRSRAACVPAIDGGAPICRERRNLLASASGQPWATGSRSSRLEKRPLGLCPGASFQKHPACQAVPASRTGVSVAPWPGDWDNPPARCRVARWHERER